MFKKISYWMGIIIGGAVLGFGVQFAKAWTEPSLTAPNGNVGAPINTSANAQYKSGAVGIGGLIHGYSTAIFDGNVGIGTTSPGGKLEISSNGANILKLTNTPGEDYTLVNLDSAGDFILDTYGAHPTVSPGQYLWKQAGSEVMRIITGKVGIGTPGPGYKLDVQGGQINASGGLCINGSCKAVWPTSAGNVGALNNAYSAGYTYTSVNNDSGDGWPDWSNNASNATNASYSTSTYGGNNFSVWPTYASSAGSATNATNATYGRYVYNNGAYSGSGWIEPSDLGVRYANSSNYSNYLTPQWGPGSYRMAFSADGGRENAGDWGRVVMWYTGNNQRYGVRVDRADYADSAGSATNATNVSGGTVNASNYLFINSKYVVDGTDSYLRLNQQGSFGSGVYTPGQLRASGIVFTDSSFRYIGSGNTIMDSNQFYCNNGSNCHFNYSGSGPTYVGNGAGTTIAANVSVGGNMTVSGSLNVRNGSDFAEEFGTTENLAAGTVVVMGDTGVKTAKPCNQQYDKKVLGVVSDNPSIVAGKIADQTKAVIAMVGVVKVNVTTQNGNIERGDLLVTSDQAGYAMKATEDKVGTVIGKALESFSGQTGQVSALINLQ